MRCRRATDAVSRLTTCEDGPKNSILQAVLVAGTPAVIATAINMEMSDDIR